jgi:transcriptional regulator with XRE-family HTH domain
VAEAAFGVQLRQYRQAAALSLRQLAAQVDYDHSYLSQVERGQRPGSLHLAQLCDRALGTTPALATAHTQTRRPTARSAEKPVLRADAARTEEPVLRADSARVDGSAPSAVGTAASPGDVLEEIRHSLAGSFRPPGRELGDWRAVTATYAREFTTTASAELLPDLTADLQLLRTTDHPESAELAVPVAELSLLLALTLTNLGRLRGAGRWWRTARAAADGSGERWVGGLVCGWAASSGLAERRPLPQLLELTEEAMALADDPDQLARALASRAQVLAALGDAAGAQRALQGLVVVSEVLPVESASLFTYSQREVFGVEGEVWATLGQPAAAYESLDRALSMCPAERQRERAELELVVARCLVMEGDVAAGLAVAMRVLVELPDQWHTHPLYEAAGRVLTAVQGDAVGRLAVRDYRELLGRRPFEGRSVGSGSSSGWLQG